MSWLVRLAKAAAAVLGALTLVLCLLLVWMGWGRTPPKQNELITRFQASRASYEHLRAMFQEDRLKTVGNSGAQFARQPFIWVSADQAGIAQPRALVYAKLMAETKTERIDRGDDGSVSISMAGWGMANKGWRINLVWTAKKPDALLASIDDFHKSKHEWEEAYSHVADNWYLVIVW